MSSFSKSSNTSQSRKPGAIAQRHLFIQRLQLPGIRSRQETSDSIAKEIAITESENLCDHSERRSHLACYFRLGVEGSIFLRLKHGRGVRHKKSGSDHKSHMKTGKRIEKYDLISQRTTVISSRRYAGWRFVVPARKRHVFRRLIMSPHGLKIHFSHSTFCLTSLHHVPLSLHSVHLFTHLTSTQL